MSETMPQGQSALTTPPLPLAGADKPRRDLGPRTTREEIKKAEPAEPSEPVIEEVSPLERLASIKAAIGILLSLKDHLETSIKADEARIERFRAEVEKLEAEGAPEAEIRKRGRAIGDAIMDLPELWKRHSGLIPELSSFFEEKGSVIEQCQTLGLFDRPEEDASLQKLENHRSGPKREHRPSEVECRESEIKADFRAGKISKAEMREQIRELRRRSKKRKSGSEGKKSGKKSGKDTEATEHREAKKAAKKAARETRRDAA